MSAEAAAEKLREKLRKLFALLGSSNAGESEAARCKIHWRRTRKTGTT
jgi:hypothetical protein